MTSCCSGLGVEHTLQDPKVAGEATPGTLDEANPMASKVRGFSGPRGRSKKLTEAQGDETDVDTDATREPEETSPLTDVATETEVESPSKHAGRAPDTKDSGARGRRPVVPADGLTFPKAIRPPPGLTLPAEALRRPPAPTEEKAPDWARWLPRLIDAEHVVGAKTVVKNPDRPVKKRPLWSDPVAKTFDPRRPVFQSIPEILLQDRAPSVFRV